MHIWLIAGFTILAFGVNGRLRDLGDLYWYIAIACWATIDLYWGWTARNAPRSAEHPRFDWKLRPAGLLPYLLYCLPLSAVPVLGQRVIPESAWLEGTGAILCVTGTAFAIWGRTELADLWSGAAAPAAERHLVQTGPYALVRHPIYAGMILLMLGMLLVLGEARALIFVFGMQLLLKKLRHEDILLGATYPGEFPGYQARVKRLVPLIW